MKKEIEKWDILLLIGCILAPMTSLRIWKIGPAEIVLLVWSLKYIDKIFKVNIKEPLNSFWLSFIFIIFISSLFGLYFYPNELDLYDIISYIFFYIVSMGIYVHFKDRYDYIEKFFYNICKYGSLLYIALYFYSILFSRKIIGVSLWYSSTRFAGGATNPHQLAPFIGVCTIVLIYYVLRKRDFLKNKILSLLLIIGNIFVIFGTKSSTLILSLSITSFFLIMTLITDRLNDKSKKIFVAIVVFLIILLFLVFKDYIFEFFMNWVKSDENGVGRITIFSSVDTIFHKNPIFGLGPGDHALNGTFEFHNTYLEIFAMTGIIGLFIFLKYSKYLFENIKNYPIFLLSMIILYTYGFAGFTFRRLIYWILQSLAYSAIKNKRRR